MTEPHNGLSAGSDDGLTIIERVRLAIAMTDAGYAWDVELEYVEELLKAYDDLSTPAQSALEPEVVAAAQRAIMANPLYRDKFGDSPVAAFGLAYSALKVLVPQRSPAATVETKAYSDAYTQENIEILESEVRRLRNENSQLAAAITAQPPAAHPSLSADNGGEK